MSIDTDLNRIATSLEEIVKVLRSNAGAKTTAAPVPTGTETLGGKKSKAGTPVPAPVAEDPITGQPITPAAASAAQPTMDEVHVQLRLLKDNPKATGGMENCKKLMIKHGANKDKPVISSIPPANYAALIAEIGTLL